MHCNNDPFMFTPIEEYLVFNKSTTNFTYILNTTQHRQNQLVLFILF